MKILKNCIKFLLMAAVLTGCPNPTSPRTDSDSDPGKTFEENSELFEKKDSGAIVFETNERKYESERGYTVWGLKEGKQEPFAARDVEMVKVRGYAGAGYGIVLCHGKETGSEEESMLVVMINTEKEYTVGKVVDGVFTYIEPWTYTDALDSGYGAKNRLRIERDGSGEYTIKINGAEMEKGFRDENDPVKTGGDDGYIVVLSPRDRFGQEGVRVEFTEAAP
ncbi:hypothetical protein [Breznakiella homolactica]|uniref:DUF1080 domain-containing protein n=1 Tax=Breznakiella homolactica TaxID=2798577 RepID=A0A7T7XQR0_9SPIR|nr:hypothetical protein [Breznakiella homolactica]QQO10752.1 hypothetical protein JFL75_07505 [Breznakiella homolactica]